MKVKALKTFDGREGFIRAGSEPNLSDGYARELARNGLVQLLDPSEPGPAPENTQAKPSAPMRAAAAVRPGGGKRPGKEPALGDGPVLSPLSSRAAPARVTKTPKKSASGGKKTEAETTPPSDPTGASS